jgi:hypothetical protein
MKWAWLLIIIVAVFFVLKVLPAAPPWRGTPGQTVTWQGRIYRWEQDHWIQIGTSGI